MGWARLASAETIAPEESLARLEAARPFPRDPSQLARTFGFEAPTEGRTTLIERPTPSLGATDTFWVLQTNPARHVAVTAELRYVGRHANWYVQSGFSAGDDAIRRSAARFDRDIYPNVRRTVGSEAFPGIDNDPRITVFAGDVPGVAGYVSALDGFPTSMEPFSNQREMVYLNLRASEFGTDGFDLVLAHEFVHLVHQNLAATDDTWVKEGLADYVSASLFGSAGLPGGALSASPDVQLTSWTDGPGGQVPPAAHYQAASWFLKYFADRFGAVALQARLRDLQSGPAGFARALGDWRGGSVPFVEIFRDWTVANLGPGRVPPVMPAYLGSHRLTPLVRALEPTADVRERVAQFGADYYEVAPPGPIRVVFRGDPAVSLLDTVADEEAIWYGGRADLSQAVLERDLDLRALSQAAVSYRVWHDLETGYDFAHVAVSIDGGASWRTLETDQMRSEGRSQPGVATALGPGYSGVSGGGATPVWIDDRVDLSAFSGRQILLRFLHVTDDAIVRDGIALTDFRVEEGGSRVDIASDTAAWTAVGWSRVGTRLPQRWLVTLLTRRGSDVDLVALQADGDGVATWEMRFPVDQLTLIVSGATPITTQRPGYELQVRPLATARGLRTRPFDGSEVRSPRAMGRP